MLDRTLLPDAEVYTCISRCSGSGWSLVGSTAAVTTSSRVKRFSLDVGSGYGQYVKVQDDGLTIALSCCLVKVRAAPGAAIGREGGGGLELPTRRLGSRYSCLKTVQRLPLLPCLP